MHTLDRPVRLYDTRPGKTSLYHDGKGKFAAEERRAIKVHNTTDLSAVFVNITVTETSAAGYLTAYGGQLADVPTASNLNWSGPGQTFPNLALVPVSGDKIHIFAKAGTEVIVDLQGLVFKS